MAEGPGLRVRFRLVEHAGGDSSSAFEEGRLIFREEDGIRLRRASHAAKTPPLDIDLDLIDDVSVDTHEGIAWRLTLALIEEDEEPRTSLQYLEIEVAAESSGQAEPLALKATIDALLEKYTEVVEDRGEKIEENEAVDALQFSEAEYDEAAALDGSLAPAGACSFCHEPLADTYYDVNGAASCERCLAVLRAYRDWGSPGLRFLKALLFGSIAAAAGAALYYAIVALTGYEISLVAIVVGLMVGAAVRLGSQRRGGPGYQALAMILTYLAIVTTYMHMIGREIDKMSLRAQGQAIASLKKNLRTGDKGRSGLVSGGLSGKTVIKVSAKEDGKRSRDDATVTLRPLPRTWLQQAFLFGLAFVWPFLAVYEGGGSGIMGLIIVGFAIYEAWKLCKRAPFAVDGPLRISGVREAEG